MAALAYLLARPVATVLTTVVLALMGLTAVDPGLHARLATELAVSWPQLETVEIWRVPSSTLLQEDTGWVPAICALLPVLFAAESRVGSARLLAWFFGGDAIASVPVLAAIEFGGAPETAGRPNLGSSAGLIAVAAALIAGERDRRHRTVGMLVVAAGLAVATVADADLASVQHLIAAAAGMAFGTFRRLSGRRAKLEECSCPSHPRLATRCLRRLWDWSPLASRSRAKPR